MQQPQTSLLRIALAGLAISLAGVMTFVYPDDWNLPLGLAAIFGPFMGMRMGFDGALWFVLLTIVLVCPVLFRVNVWTGFSALIGTILWLYAGFMCGQWLYA